MKFRPGLVLDVREFGCKKVVFRFPKTSDAPSAMRYINAIVGEKARILMTKRITLSGENKWLKNVIASMKAGTLLNIFAVCDGEIFCVAGLDRHGANSADRHVAGYHIAISKEFRGLGLATYISKLVFGLAKKGWKTKVLRSSYIADNVKSAALHKRLGFKVIGRIPKATKYGNKYIDEVLCYRKI